MKRARAVFAAGLVCLSAMAAMARPIAMTGATNLRDAPGTDAAILALIPKGAMVEVGDCRGGWCRVTWNGQDGYAVARNLATAAPPQWPTGVLAAAPAYGQGPWFKARKGGEREGAHEEGDEHSFVLAIGPAGEWPLRVVPRMPVLAPPPSK